MSDNDSISRSIVTGVWVEPLGQSIQITPTKWEYLVDSLDKDGVTLGELEVRFLLLSNFEREIIISMEQNKNIGRDIIDDIQELAEKMQALMPPGKKPDTIFYWKGNKNEIKSKLLKFFSEYGTDYTMDEILDATKRYVDSFNGNFTYMRLLKYFIYKQEVKNGERIDVSELATFLENKDEGTSGHHIIGLDWSDKPL